MPSGKGKAIVPVASQRADHAWYAHINQSRIDLGKGKRQIVKGGILDKEYLITVPGRDEDEKTEPVF